MIENGAEWHVDETQEELQIGTTVDLYERSELNDLEAGLLLARVAQHIGHNGRVVRNIHADLDRNRFAFAVRGQFTR